MNSTISKPGVFIPKYTHYAPDGLGRDNYIIYNNGLSFGQNAERFNAISLGTDIQLLPSNINLTQFDPNKI